MEPTLENVATPCADCGQAITEHYCGHFGQRRFVESDRRFGHPVRVALHASFSWDGPWFLLDGPPLRFARAILVAVQRRAVGYCHPRQSAHAHWQPRTELMAARSWSR